MIVGLLFNFLFIRGVAQFLTYVIIYPVDSSNRGLEFHFIKLFIMKVDLGQSQENYKSTEMKAHRIY